MWGQTFLCPSVKWWSPMGIVMRSLCMWSSVFIWASPVKNCPAFHSRSWRSHSLWRSTKKWSRFCSKSPTLLFPRCQEIFHFQSHQNIPFFPWNRGCDKIGFHHEGTLLIHSQQLRIVSGKVPTAHQFIWRSCTFRRSVPRKRKGFNWLLGRTGIHILWGANSSWFCSNLSDRCWQAWGTWLEVSINH